MILWILILLLLGYFILAVDCSILLYLYSFSPTHIKYFTNKVVWITGASSGIGRTLAVTLSSVPGIKLILSARNTRELLLTQQLCEKNGLKDVHILHMDLLDFSSHERVVNQAINAYGRVDVLVNNAGRSQRSLIMDTSIEVDKEMFDLNVLGAISITRMLIPHLENHKSCIATISSIAGFLPSPVSGSYAMSKHALHGWIKTLQIELANTLIETVLISPGPVLTMISENSYTGDVNTTLKDVGRVSDDKNKMDAGRCAFLVLESISNGFQETWVAKNPYLLFCYVWQYCPILYSYLSKKVGYSRVRAWKSGRSNVNSVFKWS